MLLIGWVLYGDKKKRERRARLALLFEQEKYDAVFDESIDRIYLLPLHMAKEAKNNSLIQNWVNRWAGETSDLLCYASLSATKLSLDNAKFDTFVAVVTKAKWLVGEAATYGLLSATEAEWKQMLLAVEEARYEFRNR